MKTTIKVLIAAMAISSVGFVGCKKGEGDPFLSLKSRKARLSGEWKVSAGKGSDTDASGTDNWVYDGTTQTTTTSTNNTITDKYTVTYEFEKDGAFKMVQTDNNTSTAIVTTVTGTWNWTGGVGDVKSKSQIVMTWLSTSTGSATQTWTGDNAPQMVMDVYQLKGKEIIFKSEGTTTSGAGTTSSTDEWTLIPQ